MNKKTQLLIALTLLVSSQVNVQAQGLDSGSMLALSNDESLLPPEVVPLDPQTASNLAASQSESRQASNTVQDSANTPGLAANTSGAQAPQELRKQAFESLYGQDQLPQEALSGQWNMNQQAATPGLVGEQEINGQATAFANAQQSSPPQSQTLTGGVKNQPVQKDTRRTGFTHLFSAATAFSAGALTTAVFMRQNNPWLTAGIFGLTMTGLANRNSFRF